MTTAVPGTGSAAQPKSRSRLLVPLLVLETVLLVAAIPSSLPHNRETDAALNRLADTPTETNKKAFRDAMDRALAPERRRIKIALSLAVANGAVLSVLIFNATKHAPVRPQ